MKTIDNLTYRIFQHPDKKGRNFEEMVNFLESEEVREHIDNIRCDTPVRYFLSGEEDQPVRQGFLSVKDFLLKGQKTTKYLIKNTVIGKEYFTPRDLVDWALQVEKNTHFEEPIPEGKLDELIFKELVEIPMLQIELNTTEYYVW